MADNKTAAAVPNMGGGRGGSLADADRILTREETMLILRMKASHFSKVVNGKVKGVPRLVAIQIGRKQLFRSETVRAWVLEVEARAACKEDRSKSSKIAAA
jgi:hypothetical protein